MPPKGFIICLALGTVLLICIGALWAISPSLFVRIYRRTMIGDYYARSPGWEQSVQSLGGRISGCVLFCFGLGSLYVLLKIMRIL